VNLYWGFLWNVLSISCFVLLQLCAFLLMRFLYLSFIGFDGFFLSQLVFLSCHIVHSCLFCVLGRWYKCSCCHCTLSQCVWIAQICVSCLSRPDDNFHRLAHHSRRFGWRLRSADRGLLIVPRHNLERHRHRLFACVGPTLWNSLQEELRMIACENTVKAHLKTLF